MIKTEDCSKVRELYLSEVVDIMRENGIVFGKVVMSWPRFIKCCFLYGCDPAKVLNFIF